MSTTQSHPSTMPQRNSTATERTLFTDDNTSDSYSYMEDQKAYDKELFKQQQQQKKQTKLSNVVTNIKTKISSKSKSKSKRPSIPPNYYPNNLQTWEAIIVHIYDLSTLQEGLVGQTAPAPAPAPTPWQQRKSSLKFLTQAVTTIRPTPALLLAVSRAVSLSRSSISPGLASAVDSDSVQGCNARVSEHTGVH
ncbi:hypothetical protein GGS20DRAFT_598936 [Poronia punctata]|nr:hypothetical protein GGS20DRAFT_598936 [Poronia punctata]